MNEGMLFGVRLTSAENRRVKAEARRVAVRRPVWARMRLHGIAQSEGVV